MVHNIDQNTTSNSDMNESIRMIRLQKRWSYENHIALIHLYVNIIQSRYMLLYFSALSCKVKIESI